MITYPLKFKPILQERIWGGKKLGDVLGKSLASETIGESWELSTVQGNVSVVSNGTLKGKNLQELIDKYPEYLLGRSVLDRFGPEFPILIKFIDAKQDLSVQLHPDDALAKSRHGSFGKTEMWYIMQADNDARLILGFDRTLDRDEFAKCIADDQVMEVLHQEPVVEGDTFMIHAGTIHAIGAGILLAEIQQTSDITYRVYDFKRMDKDGNYRELHTELALDAADYKQEKRPRVRYESETNASNMMVDSPYFVTRFIPLTGTKTLDLKERNAFTILMCVSGSCTVETSGGKIPLSMGETTLLAAAIPEAVITGSDCRLLEITV